MKLILISFFAKNHAILPFYRLLQLGTTSRKRVARLEIGQNKPTNDRIRM